MDATFLKQGNDGLIYYYCDHHASEGSTKIGEDPKPKSKSNLKKFLPLIIIFSSIFLFTFAASIFNGVLDIAFSMRMMMGSFFAIFGLFKIFNLNAFADAYSTYDILAKRSRAYAFIYPFLEILIAILYLTNTGSLYRDIFTFVLMTVSTIGVVQKIREKEEIPCACLGMVFKIPMTSVTLVEDIVMALEAFIMILLMTLGKPLMYADNTSTLVQTLKIHTTAEWVQYSALGHWVIGGFIALVFLTSILERFKIRWSFIFSKYISPILLIFSGLSLFIASIHHAIDNSSAVWYLLTHISQFGQHFWIGILLLTAGIAEWFRAHQNKQTLSFVLPATIFLIGTIFFFHQQLGAIVSVRESMNWHMFFGAMLVIGATFRVLDILFFEENFSYRFISLII